MLLDFRACSFGFCGNARFGFLNHFQSACAESAEELGALIEYRLARGFLLEVDLGAGFLQRIVVTVGFFARGGLRGGGFGLGAVNAAGALVHGALQRAKKEGAHAQIENENDGDGGQSLNDQVNELVEDFHFQQTAALRSSWIWLLIERRMRSGHKKAFAKLDIIASAVSGVNAEIATEMTAKIASEIARWLPGLLTRHGAACGILFSP